MSLPITTPYEFAFPCEKNSSPLNSSLHLISSFIQECVSCRKINPFTVTQLFKYSNNFILLPEFWIPLTLLEIKVILLFIVTTNYWHREIILRIKSAFPIFFFFSFLLLAIKQSKISRIQIKYNKDNKINPIFSFH